MREAAERAAELVEPGMRIGLGTGRTVAWLLRALARRSLPGLRCVATSPETERAAVALGIAVEAFDRLDRLDIAIDGADQVTGERWAIKGGHGAHLREKIVAAAADRFVVIVSSEKLVDRLRPPVPLELERFGLPATLRAVQPAELRGGAPITPDGGLLADYTGAVEAPDELAAFFDRVPGVTGHGLFGPELVRDVIVGGDLRPGRGEA
ncbi:MAG TPA: ribose 5-phosphate isomerase A [Solirubrobacteraceae bacterium]|nr:ribose 5-phosphate isomerase A [Solirubrobacteraceae bacterium]